MMKKVLKWVNDFAFLLAAALIIVSAGAYAYSWVEGYVDPVMTPLQISNPRQGPTQFSTTFDSQSTKLRGDCVWIGTNWYIGERDDLSVRTEGAYSDRPTINGAGVLTWLNQTVEMSPDELFLNSHANVVHQCPYRLWQTVTPFYDSNDDMPVPALGEPVVTGLQEQIDALTQELEGLK